MTAREVQISELLAAGREGLSLLSFVHLARASIHTEEKDGQQEVWCGDNVIVHRDRGNNERLSAKGSDVLSALKSFFRVASVGSPLIESKPESGPTNMKIMFRYKEGEFKI